MSFSHFVYTFLTFCLYLFYVLYANIQMATRKNRKDRRATVESLLPAGSGERPAVGTAAAAGGAPLASAALVGTGSAGRGSWLRGVPRDE
jgi:hypothetical protein